MAIPDFQLPSFLHDQDADTIHQRMMGNLPPDLDDTPGGYPWDLTRPTALENAELLQFYIPETLKIMFYMWATGDWLDYHARRVGLFRKDANPAAGAVTVSGVAETVIPEGFAFATAAVNDIPSVVFRTTKESVITDDGKAEIQVVAEEPGQIGNVAADTIILMLKPMRGVTGITNPDMTTGGAEQEDDDSLRARISERYEHSEDSYVGNDWDYIRWAKEVPGVGSAYVIPIPHGPGTVKVVVIDENGYPGNQLILDAVYEYIVSPSNRLERKAPIEAEVSVVAPTAKGITYEFKAVLETGADIDTVADRFREALSKYYTEILEERIIRYTQVSSRLTGVVGVKDFTGLLINGGVENVSFGADEYPVTEEIVAQALEVVADG